MTTINKNLSQHIDKYLEPKEGLTIITSHMNADFDAIASMLAAQKLYPDSLVVFPASQEKNLRNFFISSMAYLFNIENFKKIDFDQVKRLIIVDTKQKNRIGQLSFLVDKTDIEIHIYDHHPPNQSDIIADLNVTEQTGSTASILTEIIKQKQINITPEEATILCLGIYEDTGSFTFNSTTEQDFISAAFLLSKGANLTTISNMIAREISPQQVSILNDMIQAATHHRINGVEIVLTTISTDSYIQDFAVLVHKMIKMENINVMFAIARMINKIYIVARSRISEVDVAYILSDMGGGGHSYAASATVKDMALAQVEQNLLDLLYKNVKSSQLAKDIMSSPAIKVEPNVACHEVAQYFTRYNINTILVAKTIKNKEKVLGFVSRQIIEKALYHKIGDVPVKDYMTTQLTTVGPDADLLEVQEKIIENRQRTLPVIADDIIIGVITRTDLLNILVHHSKMKSDQFPDPFKDPINARTKNITHLMKERLPNHILKLLRSIGNIADTIKINIYVVGGFVRDLLLYRSNEDIDIVIEGDGIAFAKEYAKQKDVRVHTYKKFGTAVITFNNGFKIDVASARMEYYKFPAALPIIEQSSIKLDLFRRDFTINTLAVQLNQQKFGTLIDFFSAQRDLKDKSVRVLHNLSFVEDPTRVFRAIRFEQRFGFRIGKVTSNLIKNAVKMDFFKNLSGLRVFVELRHILEEDNPIPAIRRLFDYKLLSIIHTELKFDKKLIPLLESAKKVISWHDLLFLEEEYLKWPIYLMVLIKNFDAKMTDEICTRLKLSPAHTKLLNKDRFKAEASLFWLERKLPLENSALYKGLYSFKTELILYMMAVTKKEKIKRAISYFYTHLRDIKILLRGKDLQNIGLQPGPVYKKILDKVLDEKLNGNLKTVEDEMNFVKKYKKNNRDQF